MKNNILILSICCALLTSCGPKMSGKDEASFNASKAKMEEKLSKSEKENLEKALRVVVLKAMKEKWNHPKDELYKGKSFDDISLKMVDGKTYSGIVKFAKEFLKEDKAEKIKNTQVELDSLTKQSIALKAKTKDLDNFKLTKVSISEDDFFGPSPFLDLTFLNKTGSEIIGEYMYQIDIYSKATGKIIASQQQGGSFNAGSGVKPNEEDLYHQPLLSDAVAHSSLWKSAKYPIADLSKFDLVVKAYPITLTTKKGTLERPKNLAGLENEIKELNQKLVELNKTEGTLDELELTK
ncbi:hypothetical protein ACFOG5_15735 [Pedobacter fastidiosus]|uniref:Lipoprotein n=1 Tax=Pedobacter fastidiosus TaxID=2765361 RepID=A0ABR7KR46_9SPHI|nr:hypothetical protein [Pedobacter fastidiosus]MBC6110227.1 hypothetical protein [Pedobacter fastidiosus]